MKFYALVLFSADEINDSAIEDLVNQRLEPFKLIEDDSLPYNDNWKWDYYCLYEKEIMHERDFGISEFPFQLTQSEFIVYPTDKMTTEHVTFALLTPSGDWLNGPYPLQEPDPLWPEKALAAIKNSQAKYGVYVFCHS